MKIIVEGPAGYPIDEPRRLARLVVEALRQHPDMHGAVVNVDEGREPFAYAGLVVEVESRVGGDNGVDVDTRNTIINACAARQRIYYDNKIHSLDHGNDDRFDCMQTAQEACDILCVELLAVLGLAPHNIDADEMIKPIRDVAAHG